MEAAARVQHTQDAKTHADEEHAHAAKEVETADSDKSSAMKGSGEEASVSVATASTRKGEGLADATASEQKQKEALNDGQAATQSQNTIRETLMKDGLEKIKQASDWAERLLKEVEKVGAEEQQAKDEKTYADELEKVASTEAMKASAPVPSQGSGSASVSTPAQGSGTA